ncbi:MAG: ATP synthase subunit C family protein [Alphaproteobacteria bacterium]|nr:ATP synthase subunit C family protein [Alphaproteobacteria bacterium]
MDLETAKLMAEGNVEAAKLIAAALALLPIFGVGMGIGKFFASYHDAVGRNPSAEEKLSKTYFVSLAITEALGLICLVVSLIILFVL